MDGRLRKEIAPVEPLLERDLKSEEARDSGKEGERIKSEKRDG